MSEGLPPLYRTHGPSPRSGSVVLLWLVVIAVIVGIYRSPDILNALVMTTRAAPRAVTPRGELASDEQAQISLFETVAPSVVYITNIGVRRDLFGLNVMKIPQGTGTGFIWDERGHIVTNFHVIDTASQIEVMLQDGTRAPAELVGAAPEKDLAVIKIAAEGRNLRAIPVGTSKDLKVGQRVYAIGNPFGLDHTMTAGIVSAIGREIQAANGRTIFDVIQTDAAINPGNSGGPLLDSAARVIGINTAIFSQTGSHAGIGFAVPVDTVNHIVPQLIESGRLVRPTIGVHLAPDHIGRRIGVEGLLIVTVVPGSGAATAGLRGTKQTDQGTVLGDVILAVDRRPVKSLDELLGTLERHAPGDRVVLTLLRGRERVEVEVTLNAPAGDE